MAQTTQSPLLALPPEMRNRIYRFVVVTSTENDEIEIGKDHRPRPPFLLHTCHQLRQEAIKIYHEENHFHFRVHDCDASGYMRWVTVFRRDKTRVKARVNISISLRGRYDKANLMKWLEAMFSNADFGVTCPPGTSKRRAYYAVFDIVRKLYEDKKYGWEDARMIVEHALAMYKSDETQ